MTESDSSASSDTVVEKPKSLNQQSNFHEFENLVVKLAQFPNQILIRITLYFYLLYQYALHWLFAPVYIPPAQDFKPLGRIAIIGAGLTGISTAATFVDHGFEVRIYESDSKIGGIWSEVNSTSSLQLNSILYRFHPSITWTTGFPHRDEIVEQIEGVWKRYNLESSTRLNTRVFKVSRHQALSTSPQQGGHSRWVINDGEDGIFDAIVVSLGSCGEPVQSAIPGVEKFNGTVVHSSKLDGVDLQNRRVVIIGSGASAVEAAELAVEKGANGITVLARYDKWIIPRNTLFDIFLALQPFGREMPLSFIPEWIIKKFHYRDLEKLLAPTQLGLFQKTPIVNNQFLAHIRSNFIIYKRGDVTRITSGGVRFNDRSLSPSSQPGTPGIEGLESADVLVLATGFKKPDMSILPPDLFPVEGERDYRPPNLYLQNFSTEDWSILTTNASYQDALGVVGNWHISIYARILAVFLLDKSSRPSPRNMKLWVDVINFIKVSTLGQAGVKSGLAFFTYTELVIWIIGFLFFKIYRVMWLPFVLFGFGVRPRNNAEASKFYRKE